MPTPRPQWHLNPLGPFWTLFFMHILVLEESLGESWTRNVCDDLWMLSLAPPADSMGTPGFHGWMVRAGFEIGGNLQEVCSRRNPEPGRAGLSRAVRISTSGCSGVGTVLRGTPVTPSLNYKSKLISSKCSSFHSALRARAVQMAGLVEMKTIFLVTSSWFQAEQMQQT